LEAAGLRTLTLGDRVEYDLIPDKRRPERMSVVNLALIHWGRQCSDSENQSPRQFLRMTSLNQQSKRPWRKRVVALIVVPLQKSLSVPRNASAFLGPVPRRCFNMLAFLLGFVAGVVTLALVALRINLSKPQAEAPRFHAVGLGGADPLEPYAAYQMREIFRKLENGRAWWAKNGSHRLRKPQLGHAAESSAGCGMSAMITEGRFFRRVEFSSTQHCKIHCRRKGENGLNRKRPTMINKQPKLSTEERLDDHDAQLKHLFQQFGIKWDEVLKQRRDNAPQHGHGVQPPR
jgi:hypothetical protein